MCFRACVRGFCLRRPSFEVMLSCLPAPFVSALPISRSLLSTIVFPVISYALFLLLAILLFVMNSSPLWSSFRSCVGKTGYYSVQYQGGTKSLLLYVYVWNSFYCFGLEPSFCLGCTHFTLVFLIGRSCGNKTQEFGFAN